MMRQQTSGAHPLMGCLNRFGLVFGLFIGGGFVYRYFNDSQFASNIDMVGAILLGAALGSIGVWVALVINRQWTNSLRMNANMGVSPTNYKIDARPQLPTAYPYPMPNQQQYPQLPASHMILPNMPEMPEMPQQRYLDENFPPVA